MNYYAHPANCITVMPCNLYDMFIQYVCINPTINKIRAEEIGILRNPKVTNSGHDFFTERQRSGSAYRGRTIDLRFMVVATEIISTRGG